MRAQIPIVPRWRARALAVGMLACVVSVVPASPALSGPLTAGGWSAPRTVASLADRTFAPALAVNGDGDAVAAWFSGKPPPTYSGGTHDTARDTEGLRTNVKIVVARGAIGRGLGAPVVIGDDGDDVQGGVKTALSGSGESFVAWSGAQPMLATSHGGRFISRPLALPHHGVLARLAYGVDGPVDAFWFRLTPNGEHVLGFYCSRLNANGMLGATFRVFHHNNPNPCRLRGTLGLYQNVRAPKLVAPAGFAVSSTSVVTRTDDDGDAMAIWDDYGNGFTLGLFDESYRP